MRHNFHYHHYFFGVNRIINWTLDKKIPHEDGERKQTHSFSSTQCFRPSLHMQNNSMLKQYNDIWGSIEKWDLPQHTQNWYSTYYRFVLLHVYFMSSYARLRMLPLWHLLYFALPQPFASLSLKMSLCSVHSLRLIWSLQHPFYFIVL